MSSLNTGRLWQSRQTGFVHYCHEGDERGETIPLYENALFALALFRTHMSESVLEGRALIEKLLPFENAGNFPVYLHEYPLCRDSLMGLRLATVFFWILKDYCAVLGELKGKLEEVTGRILQLEGPLPVWAEQRLRALKRQKLEGMEPKAPHEWGEWLITLQMAGEPIDSAFDLWNQRLGCYTGPNPKPQQDGGEFALTLFDLFMNRRTTKPHPLHLAAALIQPVELPAKEEEELWFKVAPQEEWPLVLAWQNHSLVLGKRHLSVSDELEITLPLNIPEDPFEVAFYLNLHPDNTLFVDGQKSNTFLLGQNVEIVSGEYRIILSFTNGRGEGRFFGHLMRGNRPGQIACKGPMKHEAFDWKIVVRTLSRESLCSLRLLLQVQKQGCQLPLPLHASHCLHTASHP